MSGGVGNGPAIGGDFQTPAGGVAVGFRADFTSGGTSNFPIEVSLQRPRRSKHPVIDPERPDRVDHVGCRCQEAEDAK